MKKIICVVFLSLIYLAFLFFKNNEEKKLLENRIVITKAGDRLLKGYEEYTSVDINNNIFESSNEYLKISEEKEFFIRKEDKKFYFVEYNKKDGAEKKTAIGEYAKEFKFNNGYLYYVKMNSQEHRDELHKLDVTENTDMELFDLEWISSYIVKEDSIIMAEMNDYYKYNVKTKEVSTIYGDGNIFDYENGMLFLYKEYSDKEMCFYKLDINSAEEKKCDFKVGFAGGRETMTGKPIKLEDNIYILKFVKYENIGIRYENYSIFGITIFRKPVETFQHYTEYFFKVIDLKNKKILAERIKLDK